MEMEEIVTLDQLAAALDQLRLDRGFSLRDLAAAARKFPPQGGRQRTLPSSTASDVIHARLVPKQETVVTWLATCGVVGEEAQRPWLQTLDRIMHSHEQCPPGAVRVRDARPRVLGVHAAIQVGQLTGDGQDKLPLYVPRDFDADLRTKITVAGQQGGFVLVTGDSSAGKTRALFEAVKTVLPDWWLLHPRNADVLREFASRPVGRTVVWLDELQDYLDFRGGVPAGDVRGMIEAGVVLAATCWPGERTKRVALPAPGEPDPNANDRRLLGLADVLTVPDTLSTHERRRAEDLAHTDRRIRAALDSPDAGFTQVMAAGPELIRHWEHAPAYAKAVITAALDARRVGAHAPLTRDYLESAAPGYLTNRQQATPPPRWLDDALAYATELLHGATATLCPVAAGMGTITGYRVADYLHQHALRVRRTEHLPDAAWHALIGHHHPDDTDRIADNARRRGRDHEALTLYQRLIDDGDLDVAEPMADLLAERGDAGALRRLADNGDHHAAIRLDVMLADKGDVDALRQRADNGNDSAAHQLVRLLADRGDVEQLSERADNGNYHAAYRLVVLLAQQGNVDALRELADHGNDNAAHRLAVLLAERGDVEQLTERADNGDLDAALLLVDLLVKQGDTETLRQRADNGDIFAAVPLPDLLTAQKGVQAVRQGASPYAAALLVDLLAEQKDVEALRELADIGDDHAADRLVSLLAERGDLKRLRQRADSGDRRADRLAAALMAERGDAEALRQLTDDGNMHAALRLVDLLAKQGEVESLRQRADNGDHYAAARLPDLLAEQGMLDLLGREVAAGTRGAARALRRTHISSADRQV